MTTTPLPRKGSTPDCGNPQRRAVIDIGTNSVKLLVAGVSGGHVRPCVEKSEQTRLGSGFYETHRLQPESIEKTALAVASFASEAAKWNPESIRVIATSAVRDALNQSDLIEAIHRASGLNVTVISGEQEADWVFRGVTTDLSLLSDPLLILDVGGGSTEFILGKGSVQHFRESFRLGTVRLLEQFPPNDPPLPEQWNDCRKWIDDFFRTQIAPSLTPHLSGFPPGSIRLIGTGGTTTILAKMQVALESFDRDRFEALQLSREVVQHHRRHLWKLTLRDRQTIPGLPANRADVILMGAAIFESVMEFFQFPNLKISTRGLRFAALLDQDCPHGRPPP
jgi:exopolyphosphatase / guanosine-5'-triphosphate,3'-diphosphate pyrophosphatase